MLEPKLAIPLCKFRTNNHKLPIVTGRYNNINRAERKCTLCTNEELGDECHYLFTCDFFQAELSQYIWEELTANADSHTIYILFNSNNLQELTNLSKFAKVIMSQFITK